MGKTKELHGYGDRTWLRRVAKHEAGHALMLWLLDQYLMGICVREEGGATVRLHVNDALMKHPSHHLLYVLAGMVMASEYEIMDDLREHVANPDYFAEDTDSRIAAQAVSVFNAPPLVTLMHHDLVMTRMRRRFSRQYNELLSLLLQAENHMLDFRQLHELYGKWDREAGFDKRPKSDFLMRALLREYRQKPPRCKWLGWDMKPLEKWEYEPPTLMDVAEKVKEHLENKTLNN